MSTLFPLRPINLGTGKVQSQSSYFIRLAEIHRVTPGKLLNKLLVPHMQKSYLKSYAEKGGTGFYKCSHLINGIGDVAGDFADVISLLSGRMDIHLTSLLPLNQILCSRGLLRTRRAWCPKCLADSAARGTIYEQLIWTLREITHCPEHHIPLQEACADCGSSYYPLDRKAINGYCVRCGSWLGQSPITNGLAPNQLQAFAGKFVSDLLAEASAGTALLSRALITNLITSVINNHFSGNLTSFSQKLNIPKTTTWGWYHGEQLLPLGRLLEICFSFGITASDFLSKRYTTSFFDTERPDRSKRTVKKIDWAEVGQNLQTRITECQEPMPPLKQIAQELNISKRSMQDHFPSECRQLAQRKKQQRTSASLQRLGSNSYKARQLVTKLVAAGIYPSRRKIEREASTPGFLREANTQKVWQIAKHIILRRESNVTI